MPFPSSTDAPRFKGNNLKSFLEDYNISTEGAGWSDKKKCENLHSYCSSKARDFVKKLPERKRGDWPATVKRLVQFYTAGDPSERYSRDKISRFAGKDHKIKNRKQFISYHREFESILASTKSAERISDEDKNRYFWKGLPSRLRQDISMRLHQLHP
ncbi:hypothetical protein DL93DRAFT_2035738, partial [Clavulina sp. PMI_390]